MGIMWIIWNYLKMNQKECVKYESSYYLDQRINVTYKLNI